MTNARGGRSFHNYGVAIDFALLIPDGKNVSWDTKRDGNTNKKADWSEVVAIAKALGFEWGGDWTTFVDLPHLQITFGLTINDYATGRKASADQEAAALAKITKTEERDEMTAEEKAMVSALKDRVAALESHASQPAPVWAKDAVAVAVKSGIVDAASAEGGSYDFYRVLTVLHRKKLI